ncbi:uncharacterized protein BX664DRAFT_342627 [Halteromyces radiatus]|uniref:uncharacterized protein n=1 Tax=Halteromyces radiatus TaxID=101107 RepID=UPI00222102D7|nr:uncharacterized protein BX664DRAFT_342627 [Halteromyces radiatus]KAI8078761.1 hypothetical protein BX664DRAFT_342627 [Halteromyces radiatus]
MRTRYRTEKKKKRILAFLSFFFSFLFFSNFTFYYIYLSLLFSYLFFEKHWYFTCMMPSKVTLSSPPVQLASLNDGTNEFQPTSLEDPSQQHQQQQQQQQEQYLPTETMRPPTPPKPKQSMPAWKQARQQRKESSNNTSDQHYSKVTDQQHITKSSSNNRNTGKSTNNAYDYDQYLYHQQALQAESIKKRPGHMDELFIMEEQLNHTCRERDQLVEENSTLKYYLHHLQYRLQHAEYMWQRYYSQLKDDKSLPSAARQQRPPYPYSYHDYFTPSLPIFGPPTMMDFPPPMMSSLNLSDISNHHSNRRARRHRSKSLPRNISRHGDNEKDDDAPYIRQPMMFQPPMFVPPSVPMMNKLPTGRPPIQHLPRGRMNMENNDDSDSEELGDFLGQKKRSYGLKTNPIFPPHAFYPPFHQHPPSFGENDDYYSGQQNEEWLMERHNTSRASKHGVFDDPHSADIYNRPFRSSQQPLFYGQEPSYERRR